MSAAAGAAAAAAAMTNAVAAAGGLVRFEPEDFLRLLDRQEAPVIIYYHGGWTIFAGIATHHYVMPYKGLTVVTKSTDKLLLPKSVELFEAKSLYLPI